MPDHFYPRYAKAYMLLKCKKNTIEEVTNKEFIKELKLALDTFRLKAKESSILQNGNEDGVTFDYLTMKEILDLSKEKKEFSKKISNGSVYKYKRFLAPNMITSYKAQKHLKNALVNQLGELESGNLKLNHETNITMSILPLTSKFNNGKNSQSSPKGTKLEALFSLITTSTLAKPSVLVPQTGPICIIPDLEIEDLKLFIRVFEILRDSQTTKLLIGKVKEVKSKEFEIKRPKICFGNFPNAPIVSSFAPVSLIASIGAIDRESETYPFALDLLDKLRETVLYVIGYGKANSVSYSHYIIELAKNQKLSDIIYALMGADILSLEKQRDYKNQKYNLYFLMANRFLQIFDEKSFQNFFSFRAEYDVRIQPLFDSYFIKILNKDETMDDDNKKEERIGKEIIESVRILGAWLNQTAYFSAKDEAKNRTDSSPDKIRKLKAKFLAEMESTVMSSKSNEELSARVITRAARMSYQDAPAGSALFIDAINSGQISPDIAKNLIMAYSRISFLKEKSFNVEDLEETDESEEESENEDDSE